MRTMRCSSPAASCARRATANVWWRAGGELYTPAAGPGVLPGVTRALALELTPARTGAAPARRAGRRRRGVHDIVDSRGDAGRRARRRGDRRRPPGPGRGTAAGALAATLLPVTEKIRLGGMALANGVLVHGPTAWACAVRTDDGELKVGRAAQAAPGGAGAKPDPARPCADRRGARRCCRRSSGRCPRRSSRCRAVACWPRCSAVRSSCRASVARRSVPSPASCSPAPSRSRPRPSRCAAASSPSTTAPSTSRSGRYEHGEARPKEHERCGSHLVGPMLLTTAAGNLARRAGAGAAPSRREARGDRRRARGLDRDLRLDDPAPAPPARARSCAARPRAAAPARHARAERRAARGRRGRAARLPRTRRRGARGVITTRRRLEPSIFDLPVDKMRAGYYTDAYFNHTRRRCCATAGARRS